MKKEELVKLGLTEEDAEKVAKASEEELKGFVPKARFDEVNEAKKHAEESVKERDKQIEGLKTSAGDAKKLKEAMFSFLNRIDNIDQIVDCFWNEYFCRMEPWYLEQMKSDDLIISASPEFLLRPAAEKLGVRLIATPMNPYTGKISGKNCHDLEKKRRFLEEYPEEEIENFYSDSRSDQPMAELAKSAWLVKEHQCFPWFAS